VNTALPFRLCCFYWIVGWRDVARSLECYCRPPADTGSRARARSAAAQPPPPVRHVSACARAVRSDLPRRRRRRRAMACTASSLLMSSLIFLTVSTSQQVAGRCSRFIDKQTDRYSINRNNKQYLQIKAIQWKATRRNTPSKLVA